MKPITREWINKAKGEWTSGGILPRWVRLELLSKNLLAVSALDAILNTPEHQVLELAL
jgi:hypothetical protein